MASGNDARTGFSKEVTYGTRVLPARFFPFNAEALDYTYNRYFTPALGTGRWGRPSIVTTSVGGGSLSGDVPTTGFGFLLDGLHNNSVTPVVQGAGPARLQTHTLDTAPSKSFSVQVQVPPVTSATLLPHDLTGVMFSGITFSWDPAGVLRWEIPVVSRALDIAQSLATYVAPAAWNLLSFKGGQLLIGGVAVADIVGGGSFTVGFNLRDDAFALGSAGLINKPVENDKPSAEGTFTADFNDNTHLSRTINDTRADVVLRFEGLTLNATFKEMLEVTIPDCAFTTGRATVDGPGPVQQAVTFSNASADAGGDPPIIKYISTDSAL